jgi:hypothetical protein
MTVNWYYRRLIHLFTQITSASRAALPSNRRQINSFLESWPLRFVDDMLAGLHDAENWDDLDWDRHPLWIKFKDYVIEYERRMEQVLKTVSYNLDDENTLNLVTRGGRPEPVSPV